MATRSATVPLATFFRGRTEAKRLYADVVRVVRTNGPSVARVTKSQIAFRPWTDGRPFAWVWCPDRWLKGNLAPLVLTVDLPRRDPSPRWKEIVEVRPGRFTHHLELFDATQLDAEVQVWVDDARAWSIAKAPKRTATARRSVSKRRS